MPRFATAAPLAVAKNRAAVMEELRRLLPGVADRRETLPFGLAALDSCLPGSGLARGALHEIVPAPYSIPAAFGFISAVLGRLLIPPPERGRSPAVARAASEGAAGGGRAPLFLPLVTPPRLASLHSRCVASASLSTAAEGRLCPPLSGEGRIPVAQTHPILFVLPSYGLGPYGRLYGHGLSALGLDPARLVLVETAHRKDTLWAVEEALRSGAPAAIATIVDKLDLKTSQRLHLFATEAALPLFLLRPARNLESSAAATRWRVGVAEAARDRFGLFTHPRWHLHLERARNGRPGEWVVEYDHVAHRFSLAAALADPAHARGASEEAERKSHCA
jgi:protein ImuA